MRSAELKLNGGGPFDTSCLQRWESIYDDTDTDTDTDSDYSA